MTYKRAKQHEFFSIEEANAMLPLVRAIVSDLMELSRDVTERRRRLSFLMTGHNHKEHDLYQEELIQIEQELDKDTRRLCDYREELRSLGVEAEHGQEGYVHFPALLDDRQIFFCWKLGEFETLYWHDTHKECSQRHGLTTDSMAGGMSDETLEQQ
jgi:hypothetical protein